MDIRLNYEEKGRGDPLILLHGNGESKEYFIHQMDFFAQKYRVIALDTRGHGKTPRGDRPFTIRQFAEDLHDFMLEKGIEKAHILGFSDGGNIALIFALKYPEMVNKLIVNGANLDGRGVKASVQLPIVVGYYLTGLFGKHNRKHELLGLMVKDPNIKPEELQKISCETLVIAGTNDMIRTDHTRFIAAGIPSAKLVLMPGDHFIANKQSPQFNEYVQCFLDGKMEGNIIS
ncbi:MAG: alpha/beta fold hydrolase [Acutalibacteraceae bacterium]